MNRSPYTPYTPYTAEIKTMAITYCQTHTIRETSRHFGIPYATIHSWVSKGDNFKRGINAPKPRHEVDEALAIMEAKTPPGFSWTAEEMGNACGVSKQAINQTVDKTLRKIFRMLSRCPEVRERNLR